MRTPDMLMTAENGWLGDVVHGPDKQAELRKAMDEYLVEMGREPVDWSESTESKANDGSPSPSGEGLGVGATTKQPAPDGWAIVNPKGPGVRFL